MGTQLVPVRKPPRSDLHPAVYAAIIALTVWFVISVWLLFSGTGYVSLDAGVITVFFIMLVGIPLMTFVIWRGHREGGARQSALPLRRWWTGEFQTWTGPQKAPQAIIEILLPIAAVAFGITIFGLVFHLAAQGAV
jgi:hypothetical protein